MMQQSAPRELGFTASASLCSAASTKDFPLASYFLRMRMLSWPKAFRRADMIELLLCIQYIYVYRLDRCYIEALTKSMAIQQHLLPLLPHQALQHKYIYSPFYFLTFSFCYRENRRSQQQTPQLVVVVRTALQNGELPCCTVLFHCSSPCYQKGSHQGPDSQNTMCVLLCRVLYLTAILIYN